MVEQNKALYGLTAGDGVFKLMKKWGRQLSFIAEQCQYLADKHMFTTACEEAKKAAPARWDTKGSDCYFPLENRNRRLPDEKSLELRFVCALMWRWGYPCNPLKNVWRGLILDQVPLKERQRSEAKLDKIDTLGVDDDGFPVVVEAKVLRNKEADTPLRALLEAVSYGCVLQVAWTKGFRQGMAERCHTLNIKKLPPEQLTRCPIAIVAPADYWEYWKREPHMNKAKDSFARLLATAGKYGFPTRLISVEMVASSIEL